MKNEIDHKWEALPPGARDRLLRGLADMCGLEREWEKVHELSMCHGCFWIRVRHTYGVTFLRDPVIQDNEPACEPKPHSPEFQTAIDAFEARHRCECGEVNLPTAKVCSRCGEARP